MVKAREGSSLKSTMVKAIRSSNWSKRRGLRSLVGRPCKEPNHDTGETTEPNHDIGETTEPNHDIGEITGIGDQVGVSNTSKASNVQKECGGIEDSELIMYRRLGNELGEKSLMDLKQKSIVVPKNLQVGGQQKSLKDTIVHDKNALFKTKCSGKKLVKLFQKLDDNRQIKAIHDIGFGGLLSLQLDRTSNILNQWIVDSFDGSTCLFKVGIGKEFMVSEYDVYDMFCLPLNHGNDVVEISRGKNDTNPHMHLKTFWRKYFNLIGDNAAISLKSVRPRLISLKDGGEVFEKLFVLYAFSSFLAPTASSIVDLRLTLAVDDVAAIPRLN
uniref:Uncharacterized protein n=1 Tax=Chenopodium quinoa TaxID=63459 RepID=A0A803MP46_CHEQI